jgi:hypothetical protein
VETGIKSRMRLEGAATYTFCPTMYGTKRD